MFIALALFAGQSVAAPQPMTSAVPRCRPGDVTLRTDGKDGDFNGMSHSGTLLIVQNRSRRTCSVEGLPAIRLQDGRGRALAVTRNVPVGMHPGPVIVPVRISAGGAATTGLRWVSGPVFDHSHCYTARAATVSINGATIRLPFAAHLCGQTGRNAGFDQPILGIAG